MSLVVLDELFHIPGVLLGPGGKESGHLGSGEARSNRSTAPVDLKDAPFASRSMTTVLG